MTKLYFLAGEASGDARGAELMASLAAIDERVSFHGMGGHAMREIAGPHFHDWSEHAVIGIIDVIKNYGYFKKRFDMTLDEIASLKPDAVILIDYPGFNLRLAKAIRRRRLPVRIIYYVSPQVWAWNRGRIPRMARVIDLMICIFPFEKPLYEKSGLKTVFAGHPMLDSLRSRRIAVPRDPELVGIFPGSRKKETRKIFPIMIETARRMKAVMPQLSFEAAAASQSLADIMRDIIRRSGAPDDLCAINLHTSHELMQRASAAMVASGIATMEAAYFRLPFVIVYRVAWLTWFLGSMIVKVEFLGMANILAGREVVREFLQDEAQPQAIADEMLLLLKDPAAREKLAGDLDKVIGMLGEPGASRRAAAAILDELKQHAAAA